MLFWYIYLSILYINLLNNFKQAVTAKKAKETGTSASLLTKLHYGVTQFVAEANILVKELSSRFSVHSSQSLTKKTILFLMISPNFDD